MQPALAQAQRHEKKEALGRVLRLSFPTVLENLMATFVQFVDTAMVGSLGAAATAAVAINTTPMWLLNGITMAVGVGGTALVARMIGAGDRESAEKACRQVLLGGLVLGLLFMLLAVFAAPYLPRLLHADPAVHANATAYFRIIGMAFIPHFMGMVLSAVLRGAGDMKTPMFVSAFANLLNVVGNYLLIFQTRTVHVFGLSFTMWGAGWGVSGAAVSTAVSTAIAGVLVLYVMCGKRSRLRLILRGLKPDMGMIRRILRVGFPAALERVSINLGQLVFVGMVAALGNVSLAAHHLAITVESLSYMPGYGFSAAATTLVGQSLGAGELEDAKRYGALSISLGTLVMLGVGIFFALFAPLLIRIFTTDPDVRAVGTDLIRIMALEQPFMALAIISTGALRGAGDTTAPFLVSFGSMCVRLVFTWLFVIVLGWGVQGAWYAMVLDLVVRGLLMWLRFQRGKWAKIQV